MDSTGSKRSFPIGILLTDKGITYTYNKGEYSAYQLDAPEVFIRTAPYAPC